MKKIFSFFLLIIFLFPPHSTYSINLSKALPHYARDMEFYYQHPRPEILQSLIANLAKNNILSQADKSLMVAAFLAELARTGKINLGKLVDSSQQLNRSAKRTLAWACHLANVKAKDVLTERLLDNHDALLLRQIKSSPAPLEKWAPDSEESVLQMYLGAFMASGNPKWIDEIIDTALKLGGGKPNVPTAAAAMLYEYAPRHEAIMARLKKAESEASEQQKQIIKLIINH